MSGMTEWPSRPVPGDPEAACRYLGEVLALRPDVDPGEARALIERLGDGRDPYNAATEVGLRLRHGHTLAEIEVQLRDRD